MSRYGDADYDYMAYELDEFLKNHKPSELLKLVQDAVEWWEEKTRENVRGEWIPINGAYKWKCSNCGEHINGDADCTPDINHYCWNCGARMEVIE